jgi:hypothetical protein
MQQQDGFMIDGETEASDPRHDHRRPFQESKPPSMARAFFAEPLVHFLLLGALLFALTAWTKRETSPSVQQVAVTAGKIEHLASLFARTWQRPPTTEELKGLIDDYIREEIAYREGTKLGLDQDDTIVRRRIRQKMDFIADDLASQVEPTDAQLSDFLKENSDAYQIDTRLALRQVFLDPERHPEDLDKIATELLARLQTDADAPAAELGDTTLLEHQFRDVTKRDLASIFGERFAEGVQALAVQRWHGPIPSAYGLHLVFVEERTEGGSPQLSDVRDLVRRDWEQKKRQELAESFYQGLLEKYEIKIDWPDADAEVP